MLVSLMQFCERNSELCVLNIMFTNSDYKVGIALIGLACLDAGREIQPKSFFSGLLQKNININRSWKKVFGLRDLIAFNMFWVVLVSLYRFHYLHCCKSKKVHFGVTDFLFCILWVEFIFFHFSRLKVRHQSLLCSLMKTGMQFQKTIHADCFRVRLMVQLTSHAFSLFTVLVDQVIHVNWNSNHLC